MSEPSEKEVEAAGRALRERNMAGRITRPWDSLPKSDKRKWCDMAGAALTAAAQVREGEKPCIFELRGMNGELVPGLGGGRTWCQTHGFDCPQTYARPPA